MNEPKYTFLLPAFKARYFEEALTSIKNQTYRDFKVLVSDDCSPEDLKSIYDKVIYSLPTGEGQGEADPRFEYRRNAENMGSKSLVSHWNLLVDMCDTEYLIMASDDDVYEPNFLEEIDKLTEKYPNVDLFRGRSRCIDGEGNTKSDENIVSEWMDNLHFMHRIYQKDWAGGIASFVYKTVSLKKKGMFVDFPAAWFSDEVTNFLMADNGCCISQKIIFYVRSSDIQISGQWGNPDDSRKKVKATLMNHSWMKKYMKKFLQYEETDILNLVTKEYKEKIYRNIQNYIYSCRLIDFVRFFIQCPKDVGLLKLRMIVHYLRGRIHI